jgi:hypothetical protein
MRLHSDARDGKRRISMSATQSPIPTVQRPQDHELAIWKKYGFISIE